MRRFIRGRSVVCDILSDSSKSEVVGRCEVTGDDLSKWIVERGWAEPAAETNEACSYDLEAAKNEKLGQWADVPEPDATKSDS